MDITLEEQIDKIFPTVYDILNAMEKAIGDDKTGQLIDHIGIIQDARNMVMRRFLDGFKTHGDSLFKKSISELRVDSAEELADYAIYMAAMMMMILYGEKNTK